MSELLIKGGRVFDGMMFNQADVLVKNDRIAAIEENLSAKADFVYDAKGMLVTPGLVDTHAHFRGISSDEFGISAEAACFPFGVTAAADASGIQGDRALLDALAVKNVVFVCATIRQNHAVFSEAERMRALYGDRVVGIKVYFDTTNPEVRDITPLCEVCTYARANGMRVMVHSSHSPVSMADLLAVLAPGDILTHAYHGGENNASEDDFQSMKQAKRRGVIIDAGFAGHVHTDFTVLGQAFVHRMYPSTISTDITRCSAYKRGGRYGMTMCMSMVRALGMKEQDILRAVTSTPATALGMAHEWGHLQVGRRADIAVFTHAQERFSLCDAAGTCFESENGYRCVLTVADGEVVYRD